MPTLNLKPSHQVVQTYYQKLQELRAAGKSHEGAVAPAFAGLLKHCAKQVKLRLVEQEYLKRGRHSIRPDGVFLDDLNLRHGVWEAKDSQDALETEIQAKFRLGYPKDNILFQSPDRLVIYQGRETPVFDELIGSSPERLVAGLKLFFEYQKPEVADWQRVTVEFQSQIADLGQQLVGVVKREYQGNKVFQTAFDKFTKHCQTSINPTLSVAAIEEMLIQHLLTERIFTTVFSNPDFVEHNVIAREINQVVKALTSQSFNKAEFIKQHQLDRFYTALERAAATMGEYADKQAFLNTVYERFFQGFAVKIADTHGIVYTPQPIVEFMVRSVQEILQREFGRSLADNDVHLIDPFVGTGNFMIRVLKEIQAQNPSQLTHKYLHELHCHEVMLLPYYIASLNIEHEYYTLTGNYLAYKNISLVDTFELVARLQQEISSSQKKKPSEEKPMLVILGNPPYNVGQQHENDNNKNRKYLGHKKTAGTQFASQGLDDLVVENYAKTSKATNKNALSDVYVKAFQWATWRLRDSEEGIVAFVSNNGFLDGIAFDGMRKHLMANFGKIYHLNLKGNARTSGERRKQEAGNVFDDAIRVSVGITFLVKHKSPPTPLEVWIYSIEDYLTALQKQEFLTHAGHLFEVPMQRAQVNQDYLWLTDGLRAEFAKFIPLGTKEGKSAKEGVEGVIFKTYSRGVATSRDAWAYNFNHEALAENMRRTIEAYNEQVLKWRFLKGEEEVNVDNFVWYDDTKLSWSLFLKQHLKRGTLAEFNRGKIRTALYRPFTRSLLFFDKVMNEALYRQPTMFPTSATEAENRVICVNGIGGHKPLSPLMVNCLPDLGLIEATQCFPFYIYAEDGSQRQENLTDWALGHFQSEYGDPNLSKWDIFYYVYGLLHHPTYRENYAVNLRRELPRIPLLSRSKDIQAQVKKEDFWLLSRAGKRLADLHVHYEKQAEYPLSKVVTPGAKLHYRVDKMRLSKEKDRLLYNETLTLTGIPPEVFEYRLGNRSALEWVLEQYQVTIDGHSGSRNKLEWQTNYQAKTTKGSGLLNDPNRKDDEQYILRLIGQVITVSLETVKVVNELREDVPFSTGCEDR